MEKKWSTVAALAAFTFAVVLSGCSSSEKVAEQPAPAEQQQPTTVSQNDSLNLGAASAGRAH
jgi:predicted component of type VI protein secretion system